MTKTKPPVCPNCGAPAKRPPNVVEGREYPTQYTCGTVTSPNWSPPIYGDCVKTPIATTQGETP